MLKIESTWDGIPLAADERASIVLTLDAAQLALEIDSPYHADPPPAGPPGSVDGLWEHEVIELFLLGNDDRYLEVELGPHGHYLVLRLHHMRRIVEQGLEIEHRSRRDGSRWRGRAVLSAALLPPGRLAANAYGIHGAGSSRRHLAAYPVFGDAPDFHRLESFRPLAW